VEIQRLVAVNHTVAAENLMPLVATRRSFLVDQLMPVFQRKAIETFLLPLELLSRILVLA
jgi:hypothetical protein